MYEQIEETEEKGTPLTELAKYKGILKKFPDGIKYQEESRDEWYISVPT